MDAEILTWPYCVIGNGDQNYIWNMNHKIALNLQFFHEYIVLIAGRKNNTDADHPQHWKIKATHLYTKPYFSWEKLSGWWSSFLFNKRV